MLNQLQQAEREFIESRINIVLVVIIAIFITYFAGFWYMQVIRGPYYEELARENILKDYPLPAPRGLILDRQNDILAENRLSHNLFLTPGQSKNLKNTLSFLSNVLGVSTEDLVKAINKEGSIRSLHPVMIYRDLSLPQLAYISARKIEYPELDIHHEQKRSYNFGPLFSHVLGYVGEINEDQQRRNDFPGALKRDIVGQAGIERYYNKFLIGEPGYERKVVNTYGAEIKEFSGINADSKAPVPGKVLRLGLDFNMQKATDAAFTEGNKYGAAVAISIKTGEVMVLYSKPYYDPNDFVPKIAATKWKELITDPLHPLQNRVIQNKFSPGSTFKTIMTLAALQEGKINPNTKFSCSGSQFIYNRTFKCWKPGGHGVVDLHRAISQSCDIYFYNVGMRMDIDVIAKYAKMLGLGSVTKLDLPNEAQGLVPDRHWKLKTTKDKWYPGETISVAIGQGPILVTALQQASLMATVASDGMRIQPHLLDAVLDQEGRVVDVAHYDKQQVVGIDRQNYEFVKQALWAVVNEGGTGGKARLDGYDVCGKTGTVQVVGYEKGGNLWKEQKAKFGDHAWFVAFAPKSDPQVALAIFVEHGGHGAEAAAPIAKQMFAEYFKDRNIPPYSLVRTAPKIAKPEEQEQDDDEEIN
jgi:penicillin-binding protein 2